jgi:hypothetical protein
VGRRRDLHGGLGSRALALRVHSGKARFYQLTASIVDSKGRPYDVSTQRWAAGKGQVLWEESPGHRLDIEPEKKEYRVGETARFLVRNPFPGAKALITIERYGVQRHWLETFEESTEVIEVQVGEDHVPGFYLSAVVTSPRVEAPPSEDDLDLASRVPHGLRPGAGARSGRRSWSRSSRRRISTSPGTR